MNRDIRFRAWVKDLKEYRKVAAIHYGIVNGVKISHVELWGKNFTDKTIIRSISNVILEEDTGLKDRNGKEIYEGDILRDYGTEVEDWIVEFTDGKFVGVWDNICEDVYDLSDLEVVGNIHDKNLMEGQNEN